MPNIFALGVAKEMSGGRVHFPDRRRYALVSTG